MCHWRHAKPWLLSHRLTTRHRLTTWTWAIDQYQTYLTTPYMYVYVNTSQAAQVGSSLSAPWPSTRHADNRKPAAAKLHCAQSSPKLDSQNLGACAVHSSFVIPQHLGSRPPLTSLRGPVHGNLCRALLWHLHLLRFGLLPGSDQSGSSTTANNTTETVSLHPTHNGVHGWGHRHYHHRAAHGGRRRLGRLCSNACAQARRMY